MFYAWMLVGPTGFPVGVYTGKDMWTEIYRLEMGII